MVVLVLVLAAADLLTGGVSLSFRELFDPANPVAQSILLKIRLPRLVCATLSGAALALAGCQMQAVFRNPLADPHILGISSGAGLGAALAAAGTIGAGALTITSASFAGAAIASLGIVAVSARFKGMTTLLIFGVLLGFVFSAVTTLCQYFSSEESLKLYHSWVSGSFASCSWTGVIWIAAALAAGLALFARNAHGLDIILFGDEYAASLGAKPGAIRLRAILSCCLITAAVTAFCGPIGFVGIIAPHLCRSACGTAVHSRLWLPVMLAGAVLALLSDVISQCFSVPLPSGATMALTGIPVIMYLLLGKKLW